MMTENEYRDLGTHYRNMRDGERESPFGESRMPWAIAYDHAREAMVMLSRNACDREDAMSWFRAELAKGKVDPAVVEEVASEVESRLFARERKVEAYERQEAARMRENHALISPGHAAQALTMAAGTTPPNPSINKTERQKLDEWAKRMSSPGVRPAAALDSSDVRGRLPEPVSMPARAVESARVHDTVPVAAPSARPSRPSR
jgi:hypothetical protein